MGRLIQWPVGVSPSSLEPLSGPRAIGAGSSESMDGFVQTVSSPYGVWRWQFSLPLMQGATFRRWRGMVTALHGGANAVVIRFRDPDEMTLADLGVSTTPDEERFGVPWANDEPWTNGQNWRLGRPMVAVAVAADRGETEVRLAATDWGHDLDVGDFLGFVGVFGLHVVTQRLAAGRYRIWPPLRAGVTTDSRATLTPSLAMRLEGETGANLPRGVSHAEGLTITLVEVEHRDVVDYFAA